MKYESIKQYWPQIQPFIFFVLLISVLVLGLNVGTTTLFDTSDFLFRVFFEEQLIFTGEPSELRGFPYFLTQSPILFYKHFVGKDIFVAAFLYQVILILWPILLVALNYLLIPKNKHKLIMFHLAFVFISFSFSFYLHVSEMNLSIGFMMIALGQLLSKPSLKAFFIFAIATLFSFLCYPIGIFAAPVILFWSFTNYSSQWIKFIHYIRFTSVIALLHSGYAFYVFNSGRGGEAITYFTDIFKNTSSFQFYSLISTSLFLMLIFSILKRKVLVYLLIIVSVFLLLHFVFNSHSGFSPFHLYQGRMATMIATTFFLFLMLFFSHLKYIWKAMPFFCVYGLSLSFIYCVYFYKERTMIMDRYRGFSGLVNFSEFQDVEINVHNLVSGNTINNLFILWSQGQDEIDTLVITDSEHSYINSLGYENFIKITSEHGGLKYSKNLLNEVLSNQTNPTRQ